MRDLRISDPPPISSGRAFVEVVMQGAAVRKARELYAARKSGQTARVVRCSSFRC
jgi:hypothetical protein